jgi:hypothetical protein
MSRRESRWLRFVPALLALLIAAIACNLPGIGQPVEEETPTPYIVFVTATPEGGAEASPGPPPVGPFGATLVPPTVEPTLDLSHLTTTPGAASATPSPSPSPTGSPTPTVTPTEVAPTATPTPLPPTPTPLPESGPLYSSRLGINFIASAQHETRRARFQAGIDTGAGWDRFAIYWSDIEQEANDYSWALYDEAVSNDVEYGLRTDAILLGTPSIYYQPGAVPTGLYEPVFRDGTDTPGSGKRINRDNPWAEFVYEAVNRYKPGGALAQREGWGRGRGIRVWEIWNEPDFSTFWGGSVEDYARLLEVAYLAARQADSQAQIMVGGLVLFEKPAFLDTLLNIFQNNPAPGGNGFPFDIVALHSYSHPSYTFWAVQRTESLLAIHGLGDIPIWLNESGVTVWDDYPGPEWATRPDQIVWRATQEEQASYVLQNAAFAFMAGAEVVFHFQLYDDCGNQPRGTTFAPHDGSLCDTGAVCWGDALGLLRNSSDNVCFNQHPSPNTPREAYEAFHKVGEIFAGEEIVPITMFNNGPDGHLRWLIFARPASAELIIMIWDEKGQADEAIVLARSEEATLINQDGEPQTIKPEDDGTYRLQIEPATNRNQGSGSTMDYMIGGPPVTLIQQTTDPFVSVLPLLDRSRAAFLVKWRSSDPSLDEFEIWYRDQTDGEGEWTLWIETDAPGEALFVGGSGRTYSFFARARVADNVWSEEEPVPQATTTIE